MNFSAGEYLHEHKYLLMTSKLFINIGFLVYNFPKIASNLFFSFFHKICGLAWTIEWYKPFLSNSLLARFIS